MLPQSLAVADLYRDDVRPAGSSERRRYAALHVLEAAVCERWRRTAAIHDDYANARANRNADHDTLDVAVAESR